MEKLHNLTYIHYVVFTISIVLSVFTTGPKKIAGGVFAIGALFYLLANESNFTEYQMLGLAIMVNALVIFTNGFIKKPDLSVIAIQILSALFFFANILGLIATKLGYALSVYNGFCELLYTLVALSLFIRNKDGLGGADSGFSCFGADWRSNIRSYTKTVASIQK